MDCSPPGSSVQGISQARILEWVAISFSRGSAPSQGLSPHLLHWQADSLQLSHLGSLYATHLVITGDDCPRNWRTPFQSNFISVSSPLAHSALATVASLLLLRQSEHTPILSLCTCYFLSWKLSSPDPWMTCPVISWDALLKDDIFL